MSASQLDNLEQLDFLPGWYIKRESRKSAIRRHVLLGMAAIGIMALAATLLQVRREELRLYSSTLQNRMKSTNQRVTEVVKLQKEKMELLAKAQILRQLQPSMGYGQIVATLGSLTPKGVGLDVLELRTEQIKTIRPVDKKVGAPVDPRLAMTKPKTITEYHDVVRLEVTGHAPADVMIANYIGRLAESGLFHNVKMMYARQGKLDGVESREFMIRMEVPQNVRYVPLESGEVVHAD